jgi:hypothetical protein
MVRESSYWEADPPSHLGRFAFAPQRAGQGVPPEENLPVEDRILKDLKQYIFSSGRDLSQAVDTLLRILESGEYPDVFIRPDRDAALYRGMSLGDEAMGRLASAIGMDIEDLEEGGEYPVSFTFKPLPGRVATSWSLSREAAEEFTDNTDDSSDRVFGILLGAWAGDNPGRLLDLDELYGITDMKTFRPEQEVVGFGDIRVSGITVVYIE